VETSWYPSGFYILFTLYAYYTIILYSLFISLINDMQKMCHYLGSELGYISMPTILNYLDIDITQYNLYILHTISLNAVAQK